ncbi:MAG: AI-2E family transporter [Calditrichaceae bacterium]
MNIVLGLIAVFMVVWVLIIGEVIILPFMIAIFFSFLLDPIVEVLVKWKIPVGIAVTLTLLLALVFLYLMGLLVYASVQSFVGQFPLYQGRLLNWVSQVTKLIEDFFGKTLQLKDYRTLDWFGWLKNISIAKGVLNSVGTFLTFVLRILIVIIFVAYLLTGKRNINTKIRDAFPSSQADRLIKIIDTITNQVQKYLGVKVIISLLTGVISIIIFYSFGLDFAIFWGFLIFLFNFIPNIGSAVASVLPALFSLLQYGKISIAFWLLIVLTILQLAMGNFVEPRLMGRSLNLSPLFVILSLIFWGYIWGIAGLILAVPILGTLTIVLENIDSLKFISVFIRGKRKEVKS